MNNENKNLTNKIEQSVEKVTVPNELLPENIEKKLEEVKEGRDGKSDDNTIDFGSAIKRRAMMKKITAAAAAFALVAASAVVGKVYLDGRDNNDNDKQNSVDDITKVASADKEGKADKNHGEFSGGMFTKINSYDDVYSKVKDNVGGELEGINSGFDYVTDANVSNETSKGDGGSIDSATNNSGNNATDGVDHSETNTMVEGIDESDIVKTDGKYIYVVQGKYVYIVKADKGNLDDAASIMVDSANITVKEMYVDNDKLIVIGEKNNKNTVKGKNYDGLFNHIYNITVGIEDSDYYYVESDTDTFMSTYDISDISSPKLLGTVTMDGQYDTSRKVGEYVYLFSNDRVIYNDAEKQDSIPKVNGNIVDADCIYVGENCRSSQVCISVDTNSPENVVDKLVVYDGISEIYFGNDAIYYYKSVYEWENEEDKDRTEIGKFEYKDGKFNAKSSIKINGSIEDKFAISEQDGYLRVLTTSWYYSDSIDYDRDNSLYVIDDSMKVVGQIESIAQNENIYAARYVGDLVYFITYRNTDPLFIADLSDPTKPQLLGEATVTGFSDYLHMYDEGLCLGIGEERDETNSAFEGVKLCMFDVSDSENPKVLDELVESDMYSTPAAYNYKSVLIDSKKNVIGLLMTGYTENTRKLEYKVYGWNDNGFVELLSYDLLDDADENDYMYYDYMYEEEVRGIYIEDSLYIVTNDGITSFDMDNQYNKQDEITFATTLYGESNECKAVIMDDEDLNEALFVIENEKEFKDFCEENKSLNELEDIKEFAKSIDYSKENLVIDLEVAKYRHYLYDYEYSINDMYGIDSVDDAQPEAASQTDASAKSGDDKISINANPSTVSRGYLYHNYTIDSGNASQTNIYQDSLDGKMVLFMDRMPKNVNVLG